MPTMAVAELIAELLKHPSDAKAFFFNDGVGYPLTVDFVTTKSVEIRCDFLESPRKTSRTADVETVVVLE